MKRLIVATALLAFAAACGQTGALYLPEKHSAKVTADPQAPPAEPDRTDEPRKRIH